MKDKPNGCRFLTHCTLFLAFICITVVYCQTWFDLLFSVILKWVLNIHSDLTDIHSIKRYSGKTWKMDMNDRGKFWKMHTKTSRKVIFSIVFLNLSLLMRCTEGTRYFSARWFAAEASAGVGAGP